MDDLKEYLKVVFLVILIALGIGASVMGSFYIIHEPKITKGTIEVDDEKITCMDTKYFIYIKDHFIRCQSYDGEKYLVTGKFKFIKEKDNGRNNK